MRNSVLEVFTFSGANIYAPMSLRSLNHNRCLEIDNDDILVMHNKIRGPNISMDYAL